MSALGFLSACPGKARYVLGAPLFNRATINLPNGRQTVIEAVNNGPRNIYSDRPSVNGKPLSEDAISHKAIAEGSRLVFNMKAAPSQLG